uniref:Reverse transcriptase domain-containing protein n=1 Tax=Strongyloides venezuelensis TaxID=75913 RepID=A0A0K0FV99_STRVS
MKDIPIQRSVGQGDNMSTSFFLIIMERIVREFANDTCLIGESEKDAQKMLVLFERIAKKHGLVLHSMKTKLMCLDEVKIKSLDGTKIKQV